MKMQNIRFPSRSGTILAGTYHSADSDAGVIIAHGSSSNKDREKLVYLAEELNKTGLPVLRFDCRGSGGSGKGEVTVRGYFEDLCSARAFMLVQGHRYQGLMGDSLGGLTALQAYDANVRAIALWAPVTAAKAPGMLNGNEEQLREKGYIERQKEGRTFRFPREYFDERQSVDQEALCARVNCPVLVLHGDKDTSVPLQHSKRAMSYLPAESKLVIVKGGTHNLEESLERVIPRTVQWFRNYL